MLTPANFSHLHVSSPDMSDISDEVMLILSWVVFGVLCLAFIVFGIITNIINIICFVKQGFQDSVNISFLALSVSDLFSLITLSWLNVAMIPAVLTADLVFDPMEVSYLVASTPHLMFSRLTTWTTALITLERCLCVIAPLKIKGIFTATRTAVVVFFAFTISIFLAVPAYVVNKLDWKFSFHRNKTILGLVFSENIYYIQNIMFITNSFVIPFSAFIAIVILTIILVIKLQNTTEWRKKSTSSEQVDRVFIRNKKVAKMAVMVSTLFIVCFAPITITVTAIAFEPALFYGGKYLKIGLILGGFSFILESVNSSMNIFIYYYMSSNYRGALWSIFCKWKNENYVRSLAFRK